MASGSLDEIAALPGSSIECPIAGAELPPVSVSTLSSFLGRVESGGRSSSLAIIVEETIVDRSSDMSERSGEVLTMWIGTE